MFVDLMEANTRGREKGRTHGPPGYGRFVEPDPIGYEAGPNLYAYVGNDPINFVDPFGLCAAGEIRVGGGVTSGPDGEIIITLGKCRRMPSSGGTSSGPSSPGVSGSRGWLTRFTDAVQRVSRRLVCSFESVSTGGDFALGVGPVLRGSAGFQWNQNTGQVSWYRSIGVGYGAAFIGGVGGAYSTHENITGYSSTWNAQVAAGGGLTASRSGSQTSLGVGLGPRVGAEISKTENSTRTGNIYVANEGCS